MIFLQILLLAVGFTMLIKGADWFVEGSAGIARRLGIPQLVIGLTIVAMGTSAPEAAVSISAALHDTADIAIGNVVGSNILNILIILGITALIRTLKIQKSTLGIEIPFMVGITVVLILLGLDGVVSLPDGIALWVLFLAYLFYLFMLARKGKNETDNGSTDEKNGETDSDKKKKNAKWYLELLFIVIGCILIVWGSNLTVNAATAIAGACGISQRFIGLTVVALGTSLPELVTSVVAAMKGNSDIAIGNIVGSNIFNILFVIGTSALITPVIYPESFLIDGIVAVLAGLLLFVAVIKSHQLKKGWGIVFLLGYAAYFIYLL